MPTYENNDTRITANRAIPYSLISEELDYRGSYALSELTEIAGYYDIYRQGAEFVTEGTKGDYVPAKLRYKLGASLIKKESRFMFAESPDVHIRYVANIAEASEEVKRDIGILQNLVDRVLEANSFSEHLVKANRDAMIGKRVAYLVNFNEEDGITITFIPSTHFIYETKTHNANVLEKFVALLVIKDEKKAQDREIFKKKYTLEEGAVYLEETIYDGAGKLLEVVTEKVKTKLSTIPAGVILNDGLTGDSHGESELAELAEYESWFSKLSNADKDAERKSMNAITYTIDMEPGSTKELSSSPGSYWDLQTDQDLDNPSSKVGRLESNMAYSDALGKTLGRIKGQAHELMSVPNLTIETLEGTLRSSQASGKALKVMYWDLIVKCKEKFMTWGPQLRKMVDIIIKGALAYPRTAGVHTDDNISEVDYFVEIVQNHPLPEDEQEEKQIDLAEVAGKTMSRKAYMQKWRLLTDQEVDSELEQIARERQLLEDSAFF